jgi:hypothetical protein
VRLREDYQIFANPCLFLRLLHPDGGTRMKSAVTQPVISNSSFPNINRIILLLESANPAVYKNDLKMRRKGYEYESETETD